jgi:predicted nucleotidyltransferase
MVDIEELKPLIVERLKPLKPEKIILFGSYAYGKANEDSDIDLYIVTSDNFIPKSWREKSDLKLKYFRNIEEIARKFGLDLILHTKPMYEKFKEYNSSFWQEIQKGDILWQKRQ